MRAKLLAATAFLLIAASVDAQQSVALQFNGGRVTLRARNAPVGAILAEWARVGRAMVVNGDRIAGAPVTLELVDVPERQALDVVLRSVAGYMLGPRRAGSTGSSEFDRIMILPTSAAPSTPPAPAAAGARPGIVRPPIVRRPASEPQEVAESEPVDNDETEPANAGLSPDLPRVVPPGARVPQAPSEEAQESEPAEPAAVQTTPSNPFGKPVGSSATPGVIAPVPRPQPQQQRPANRVQ